MIGAIGVTTSNEVITTIYRRVILASRCVPAANDVCAPNVFGCAAETLGARIAAMSARDTRSDEGRCFIVGTPGFHSFLF